MLPSQPLPPRLVPGLLRGGPPFDDAFMIRLHSDALVAGNVRNVCHDWQPSEPRLDFIDSQVEACATRNSRCFHAADVSDNLRTRGQIYAAAGFQWLERLHLEAFFLGRVAGVQF